MAIASELPDTNVRDALLALGSLPDNSSVQHAAGVAGTSGYVAHSVPLAIYITVIALDLPTAILTAVSLGGDTDTIASLVGQFLGVRGHELPPRWLERIPGAAELEYASSDHR